jgi:enoyl-CoA hydratase/carnithine racemase
MKTNQIIYELKESVGYITLNNPSKMNCMGFDLLNELNETIDQIEKDSELKVLVFQGAGDRAFSTGANLKEFNALSEEGLKKWIVLGNKIFNKIQNLNKPTIAFINGYALGGGVELALACDFRIGTETAILGSPELEHGWLPGWGGIVRLKQLVGEAFAKEILMLNQKINAQEALRLGLLNRIENENKNQLTFFIHHLKNLKPDIFGMAKTAIQNPGMTASEADIEFDVKTTLFSKKL